LVPHRRHSRRSLSFFLLRVVRRPGLAPRVSITELLNDLGDRSFGWAIILFSLVNLLPLPIGATLLTALPLILLAAQMSLGYRQVQLPGIIGRRTVARTSLRRAIHAARPVSRRIERIIKPRKLWVFYPKNERMTGIALLLVSLALFLPLPLSGWFPAISLLVCSFGMVERDGMVVLLGLALGVISILITILVAFTVVLGAEAVI